jgi:SAM-dependent methyltransferase
MADRNQSAYARPSLVRYYGQLHQLQPAEQGILERLKDRLPAMAMLDIGVGGGRTTQHFWPRVGDYTGIDYSAEMIAACRARLGCSGSTLAGSDLAAPPSARAGLKAPNLAVMDARDLSAFTDHSFDLIWFSFNGLDYVSHADRLQVLREVHRVGKPGAYFVFSSHNLRGIAQAFDYRLHLSFNPLSAYVDLVMWGLLRWFNRGIQMSDLAQSDHLILRDESHNFALQTYYIHPAAQVEQLAFGFRPIEVYPWTQRHPVKSLEDPALASPLWLYYLCQVL